MKAETIAKIEATIEKKAKEIAYQQTEHYSDRLIQYSMYTICKSYIILGARMFEEELLKLEENE